MEAASNTLLALLLPEKQELSPPGEPLEGSDGLEQGERQKIVAAVSRKSETYWLYGSCVEDLAMALSDGDPDSVQDAVDVGALIRELSLLHRRARHRLANPSASHWGNKQPNRVFLDAIGLHLAELEDALNLVGHTRYSSNADQLTGWLPDFLRAAENYAIDHGVEGLGRASSPSTLKSVCDEASRRYRDAKARTAKN